MAAGETLTLKSFFSPARGEAELATRISLAVHTTRKPRPGIHDVDVVVNGEAIRIGSFRVVA